MFYAEYLFVSTVVTDTIICYAINLNVYRSLVEALVKLATKRISAIAEAITASFETVSTIKVTTYLYNVVMCFLTCVFRLDRLISRLVKQYAKVTLPNHIISCFAYYQLALSNGDVHKRNSWWMISQSSHQHKTNYQTISQTAS